MIVLGIETATAQVGVALGTEEAVLGAVHLAGGRRHAEALTPSVAFLCRQVGVEPAQIAAVAVDVGPGLFTGLRVGVAAAKATAQALGVPLVGVSSLELLAFPVRHTDATILSVVDARKGEVYAATYRGTGGGVRELRRSGVATPEALAAELGGGGGPFLAVGDGARRYQSVLTAVPGLAVGTVGTSHPSAAALVELAHPRVTRGDAVGPAELQVVYLRKADAEINWERRADGAGTAQGGPVGAGATGGG